MVPDYAVVPALVAIFFAVLFLPFLVRAVEHQIEAFLLACGVLAVTATGAWSGHLVVDALREPWKITLAVFAAGAIFLASREALDRGVRALLRTVPFPLFVFLLVAVLGVASSLITAIVASLVLVELLSTIGLGRREEVLLAVFACFSIGLGAALTPVGEPLSTIAIGKLQGEPYHADFWFLARLVGAPIAVGMLAFSVVAALLSARGRGAGLREKPPPEGYGSVAIRAAKVYVFVVALHLLGTGFKPLIDRFVVNLPLGAIYWINMSSAILDNATLAAAEIGPNLSAIQIEGALMGLLIAGGMLIPGNIPNIIAASKLGIGSREWAKIGVPVGLVAMAAGFAYVASLG
jgi:predicted cation transporter